MNDKQLLAYAQQFREAVIGAQSSARMCFALSGPLCAALAVLGHSAQIREIVLEDCNHVFLQLQDGRVLDPTADQFKGDKESAQLPPVYLGWPTLIHRNSSAYEGPSWAEIMTEFARLAPVCDAKKVGVLVRRVLETMLPPHVFDERA